ncbi:MAG: HK97 gp10 family phage protein [Candidatus Omnitrophica bacterium]|nr:HK97 gp10 family phage protein [Candidatus Omnitrophota bacterium]
MSEIRFEHRIEGLSRLQDSPTRFRQAFRESGTELMLKALGVLQRAVALRTPVNTGQLRASVGLSQPVVSEKSVEGRLGTNVVYAMPVEFGSRPHWPPRAPIEFWVKRKLRVPAHQVRPVAFLVARKIARRGTPAKEMFRTGLEESRQQLAKLFDQLPQLVRERFGATR